VDFLLQYSYFIRSYFNINEKKLIIKKLIHFAEATSTKKKKNHAMSDSDSEESAFATPVKISPVKGKREARSASLSPGRAAGKRSAAHTMSDDEDKTPKKIGNRDEILQT
jgi:hypothetical protein